MPEASSLSAARSPFVSRFITQRSIPGVARRFPAQVTATGGSFSTFGLPCAMLSTQSATPNQALQRTGSAVTAPAADHRRLSAHRQVPRPLRLSLSLGSLGALHALCSTALSSELYLASSRWQFFPSFHHAVGTGSRPVIPLGRSQSTRESHHHPSQFAWYGSPLLRAGYAQGRQLLIIRPDFWPPDCEHHTAKRNA